MSYDIYIGNAEIESEWSEFDGCYACWTVKCLSVPEAPGFPFDGMTERSNSRHPGYTQWAEFCRVSGLHALFFDPDVGIMREHPGCMPLTPDILGHVRAALARWRERFPHAVPGWDYDPMDRRAVDDGVRGRDGVLARLIWLDWWMAWALAHCERPAIHNH